MFDSLLNFVVHKTQIILYWGRCGKVHKFRKTGLLKRSQKPGPKRHISLQEELLLVLMKLCIVIITELLSDIFGISSVQFSPIINTWMKILAATLHPLIFWPSKLVICQHVPKALKDYQHLRCNIDCTEMWLCGFRTQHNKISCWHHTKWHH